MSAPALDLCLGISLAHARLQLALFQEAERFTAGETTEGERRDSVRETEQ